MHSTGLLRKARAIRDSAAPHLRVLGPHELRADDEDGISVEDREAALAQVEQAVARDREAASPESLAFRPRRRGTLLPLLVNLFALVVIAGGIVLALSLSRRTEQELAAGPVTLLSAEGKVLETLRAESRRELEGKDQEIAAIRDRLAGIEGERQRVREAADAVIRGREEDLAESFSRVLAEERARLTAAGLSEDAIAKKLFSFESRERLSMEETLAAFREQQQAELARKEQAIQALQAESQAELSRAQSDRSRLQEESSRRQAELEAGYRQKQLSLEQDKAAALAELARLREMQERERLASDQLLSFYARAREELAASRPDSALAAMADLRRYLDEPGIASLPALARRRPVDLFLAGSLEQMVRAQSAQREVDRDVQGLVASASLVAAAASLVEEGDALFAEQEYAKAREVYLSALARIPASEAGHNRLAEIEQIFAGRAKNAVAAAFTAGNAAYRAGDYDAAVARYGSALQMLQVERGAVDTLVAQLLDIGSLRKASEVAAAAAAAAPDLIGETASLVREGDALFAGQDYAKARELYLAALARIPAVQAGYARLSEIDAMAGARAAGPRMPRLPRDTRPTRPATTTLPSSATASPCSSCRADPGQPARSFHGLSTSAPVARRPPLPPSRHGPIPRQRRLCWSSRAMRSWHGRTTRRPVSCTSRPSRGPRRSGPGTSAWTRSSRSCGSAPPARSLRHCQRGTPPTGRATTTPRSSATVLPCSCCRSSRGRRTDW